MHTMDLTRLSDALPYSTRYNSKIGKENMDLVMLDACMKNRNVTSVAMAKRNAEASGPRHPRTPCGEQMMRLMRAADPAVLSELFLADVQGTVERMKEMGHLDGPVEISLDGHKMPRDDRRQRPELINSMSKKRTGQFEAYVTAQCIAAGQKITLGVVPQRKLETVSDIVPKLIHICRRAGVEIGVVMMDREFFTAQVIKHMNENDIPFLIPCKHTDTTVDALREYGRGARGRVSELTIRGGGGACEAGYTAIITRRRRRRKKAADPEAPEERYIAFATNRPDIDPDGYGRRWNIEVGYRILEGGRARTRCAAPAARMYCLMFSCLFYNAWVTAAALLAAAYRMLGMRGKALKWMEFATALGRLLFDPTLKPEPPPELSELDSLEALLR